MIDVPAAAWLAITEACASGIVAVSSGNATGESKRPDDVTAPVSVLPPLSLGDEQMRLANTAAPVGVLLAAAALLLSSSNGLAAGDPAAGKSVFNRCSACHSTDAGANKIGPSLAGIVGRKSGSAPGFHYSPAMETAGITWDAAELDKFLTSPKDDVHGTKMAFPGVADQVQRQNLIAYLETLK